jgi:hypothetical protein
MRRRAPAPVLPMKRKCDAMAAHRAACLLVPFHAPVVPSVDHRISVEDACPVYRRDGFALTDSAGTSVEPGSQPLTSKTRARSAVSPVLAFVTFTVMR